MNFTILWITLITILGGILRLICIDKDGGLWNDEYVSWAIANVPFGKGFVQAVFNQCHMPFYYLYLKFFNMFSNNDTFLRITSVIPAIVSIPVMYLVGKEKNKLTGLMCSLFTALSSYLVYFSQEVRFYSLLFLFSALSLYFTIRLVKKPRKRNLVGLLISNFLILFTHTIGFVFVFFDLLYISYKLRKLYKKIIVYTWAITGVLLLTVLPLIVKILFFSGSMSQWWTSLTFKRILQVFCDFYTPVIGNVTVIENIHGINLDSVFLIIPLLIAIIVLLAGVIDKNLRHENQLGIIAFLTFLVAIVASFFGKLSLEAKYIMEIYPILIFIFCSTIDSCNKTWFKVLIFSIFFAFQIGYAFTPNYSAYRPREEGNKYVADLIKSAKLNKNDFIVLTYYPKQRFDKYIDFSKYNVVEIYKGNYNYYYSPFMTSEEALKTGKNKYRGTFLRSMSNVSEFTGSTLIDRLNSEVYFKMKPNQKVAFIFLDSVSFLDEASFAAVVSDPVMYNKAALQYLVFSNIRNEIIKTLPINARNLRFEAKGAWTMVSFQY